MWVLLLLKSTSKPFFGHCNKKMAKKTPPSIHMDAKGGVKFYQKLYIDLHNKTTWP